MRAIRAAHAFDGTEFLPGGATVVLDSERIVEVQVGDRTAELPRDLPLTSYAGTVLPGLFSSCPPMESRRRERARRHQRARAVCPGAR